MDELIKAEICFRELALPTEVKLSREKALKWLALSIGLISPKDSRQGIVSVFGVLVDGLKMGLPLSIEEIAHKVEPRMSEKTVYYHIKRLKDLGLVSKKGNGYILGDGVETTLSTIISKAYSERLKKVLEEIGQVEHAFD